MLHKNKVNIDELEKNDFDEPVNVVELNYNESNEINRFCSIPIEKIKDIKEIYVSRKIHSMIEEIKDHFTNKIALLQKLSTIQIGDSYEIAILEIDKPEATFINTEYALITNCNPEITIPPNIKYLNILGISELNVNVLNNLPYNIETLHISTWNKNCLCKIKNLQPALKKFSVTLISYNPQDIIDDIAIKIPFGCEFSFDYILY
jgi:hypothetical protein